MSEDPPIVIEPAGPHRATIIWLHGLGADANDFAPIARELGLPDQAGVRFVFPHAPVRAITINGGMRMRGWYDIRELNRIDRSADPEEIRESCRSVRGLITEEQARGIPLNRIVLAGFSQGAAIALQTGLGLPKPLAGILSLSGYLPLPDDVTEPAGVPVFMAHGEYDGIVPMRLGEMTLQALREKGVALEWKTYPMDHAVCPEEIADIGAWLRGKLEAG